MQKILKNSRGINQVVICMILVASIAVIASQVSKPLTAAVRDFNQRAITNITDVTGGGF